MHRGGFQKTRTLNHPPRSLSTSDKLIRRKVRCSRRRHHQTWTIGVISGSVGNFVNFSWTHYVQNLMSKLPPQAETTHPLSMRGRHRQKPNPESFQVQKIMTREIFGGGDDIYTRNRIHLCKQLAPWREVFGCHKLPNVLPCMHGQWCGFC